MASDTLNETLWGTNGTEIFQSPNYKAPAMQLLYLYANAIVRFVIGLCGSAANAFIVHITVRNKGELRTSCAHLLAANALLDIVVACSAPLTVVLTPLGHVSWSFCFWATAPSQVAFNASFVLVFFIALDRLLATLFPIWHRSISIARYVATLCLAAIVFGACLLSFAYSETSNTDLMFKCTLADFWQSSYLLTLQCCSIGLSVAAICCYALIWTRLRLGAKLANGDANRGILKSLIVLVLIILFGWIAGMAVRSVIPLVYTLPTATGYILMSLSDLTLSFNGVANAAVLYCCSNDYRRLMRKGFAAMCGRGSSGASVQNNASTDRRLFTVRNHNNRAQSQIAPKSGIV